MIDFSSKEFWSYFVYTLYLLMFVMSLVAHYKSIIDIESNAFGSDDGVIFKFTQWISRLILMAPFFCTKIELFREFSTPASLTFVRSGLIIIWLFNCGFLTLKKGNSEKTINNFIRFFFTISKSNDFKKTKNIV